MSGKLAEAAEFTENPRDIRGFFLVSAEVATQVLNATKDHPTNRLVPVQVEVGEHAGMYLVPTDIREYPEFATVVSMLDGVCPEKVLHAATLWPDPGDVETLGRAAAVAKAEAKAASFELVKTEVLTDWSSKTGVAVEEV